MQTIKTNGREIVVLDIPKADIDKKDFTISEHGNLFGVTSYGERMQCNTYLNLTGYKIIGLLSELTSKQLEPYTIDVFNDGRDYILDPIVKMGILLDSYSINHTKPLLIIEKLK